jgi:hypothetical protein
MPRFYARHLASAALAPRWSACGQLRRCRAAAPWQSSATSSARRPAVAQLLLHRRVLASQNAPFRQAAAGLRRPLQIDDPHRQQRRLFAASGGGPLQDDKYEAMIEAMTVFNMQRWELDRVLSRKVGWFKKQRIKVMLAYLLQVQPEFDIYEFMEGAEFAFMALNEAMYSGEPTSRDTFKGMAHERIADILASVMVDYAADGIQMFTVNSRPSFAPSARHIFVNSFKGNFASTFHHNLSNMGAPVHMWSKLAMRGRCSREVCAHIQFLCENDRRAMSLPGISCTPSGSTTLRSRRLPRRPTRTGSARMISARNSRRQKGSSTGSQMRVRVRVRVRVRSSSLPLFRKETKHERCEVHSLLEFQKRLLRSLCASTHPRKTSGLHCCDMN